MALITPSPNFIHIGNFAPFNTADPDSNHPNFNGNQTVLEGMVLTGHTHSIQSFTVDDANNDGEISSNHSSFGPNSGDSINGSEIDTLFVLRIDVRFEGSNIFTNASVVATQTVNGDVYLLDLNGLLDDETFDEIEINSVLSTGQVSFNSFWQAGGSFSIDNASFVCFAAETRIATPGAEVPVGALRRGDIVTTKDHGPQPIRWVGRRHLGAGDLAHAPDLQPIRIREGALGSGLPRRDLLVSPQHRMLLSSKVARRMFGADEVLVAAKHLLALDGVEIADEVTAVTYVHFLCANHEVVFAEGAPSESLYTGAEALKSMGAAARAEILSLFPRMRAMGEDGAPYPARPLIPGRRGRALARRIAGATHRAPLELWR